MTFTKTIALWLVIASLLFVNGVLAQLLFIPVLGVEAGEMMGAFIAIAIIFGVSRFFLSIEAELPLPRVLGISAVWLALTILFEVGLGRAIQLAGPDLPRYRMWDGSFWALTMLAMASAPVTWLRRSSLTVGGITK